MSCQDKVINLSPQINLDNEAPTTNTEKFKPTSQNNLNVKPLELQQNLNNIDSEFIIYRINNTYKVKKNDDNTFKCKQQTGNINEIIKLLEKDNGYHIRINPKKECIIYIDLDHCETEEIIIKFCKLLIKIFGVEENEISYTLSKKETEFSYHISIPSFITTPKELNIVFNKPHFYEFKKYIDFSVYSEKWFRLPNQTNKEKPLQHKIINGKMEDFIIHYTYNTQYEINDEDKTEDETENKTENKNESFINKTDNKKEESIKKLLSCLNSDRYQYQYWLNTGILIFNETNNINIWKEWSKGYKKYDENEINQKWNSFSSTNKKLTIATLHKYAQEDNKEKYNKLFGKPEFNFLVNLTTVSIAEHFKKLYGDKFIYQNNKLYCYNGVYWKAEDEKKLITLNNYVGKEYYFYMMSLVRNYEEEKLKDERTEEETKKLIYQLGEFRKSLLDLQNYDRRQKYIKDIINYLYDENIKFDEQPYLFAFNNKIFDLKKGLFIEPEPEYYISMTTGYNYIEQDEKENIKEIHKLINSIFPQPELKKLYLTVLSTGLDGLPLEKFILANGGGGNGKGLLNEFCQYMIGNYAYVLPVNILLGPLKTGSNPEIANMNNKRLVFAREPDRNLMFNCATIKEITGGTELNARLNHSNDTKVNLKLTFVLECNDKPKLNEVNDALSRRILDIPFKNKFVDQQTYNELDEKEKETTFLINSYYKTLEFKDKYKQALFLILAEHYKEFNNNNMVLPVPDEIIKRNREYLAKSDEFLNWFDDNYEKTQDKKDNIKLKIIYENFKTSEYFNNLNKVQKRQNNYKNFVEKMQGNMFLKKYVTENKDKVNIIINYKCKNKDNYEEDEEQCALDM